MCRGAGATLAPRVRRAGQDRRHRPVAAQAIFTDATFSGGEVDFGGATFSGGTVDFGLTTFSANTVDFTGATFSGAAVSFDNAGGPAPTGAVGAPVPATLNLPWA